MIELRPLDQPARSFFWTAPVFESSEMTSEDPLGLDYVAQQVGLMLLPTLTTRSSRAQAYAMVLYGLAIAERAIERHGYPNTEEHRRTLFERWERFWALATLEYRHGEIGRSDWDSMRGIRGAKAAWRPGEDRLPLDFPLISRQQELGHLGAYLVPLRRASLVVDGSVRPSPAALDIIDNFWDELGENRHRRRYEEYALTALEVGRSRIDRKHGNLTLAKLGEKSRLTSLHKRAEQQNRLYRALFEHARDATTLAITNIVDAATRASIREPRDVLDGAIAGRFGAVTPALADLLVTARAYGDYMRELIAAFDRVYTAVDRGGWVVSRSAIANDVFDTKARDTLRDVSIRFLDTPCIGGIRSLPMHGAACVRLAEELVQSNAEAALDRILAYHASVQRDRHRGASWIRDEAGRLTLVVTSYRARPDTPRFPSFKLDVVRTLLVDTGRLPFDGAQAVSELGE